MRLSASFDPYRAERRLLWRNRLQRWRAHPAETVFHAVGWLAVAALLLTLLIAQRDALGAAITSLLQTWPRLLLALLLFLIVLDQRRARQRQRAAEASDWFNAQPISAALRRQHRWRAGAWRTAITLVAFTLLAQLGEIAPLHIALLSPLIVLVALLGNVLGERMLLGGSSTSRAHRLSVLPINGRGSLMRWQAIEAGAALAPKALAPLLLVILLVPRGPVQMVAVALLLLCIALAINGWRRAVQVIVMATHWLHAEPIRRRQLVLRCLPLPTLTLMTASGCVLLLAWASGQTLLGGMLAAVFAVTGLLWLGVVASAPHATRRHPLHFALQLVMLVAALQSLPPLAPLVFCAQLLLFAYRILR